MAYHVKSFQSRTNKAPQEFHAEHAFPKNATCHICANRPQVRAIVMVPLDEAEKSGMVPPGATHNPAAFSQIAPAMLKLKESATSEKWYIRLSKVYSCRQHRRDMEIALAKAPSWAVVEINEGPDYNNRVVTGYRGR